MTDQSQHPETQVLHAAGYRKDDRTNAVAVPIYQTTSYQFDQHGARGQPLRPQGAGQHLHPDHEPDLRRAGAAHRGARRRRGGAGGLLGPGRLGDRDPEHRPGRRQHRLLDRPLRRHLEPLRQHLQDHGHRDPLRRPERPGGLPPGERRPDPGLLRRDPAQPEADGLPDRRGGGHRQGPGHPADRRQHRRAGHLQAARARRPHRRSTRPPSTSAATAPRSAA